MGPKRTQKVCLIKVSSEFWKYVRGRGYEAPKNMKNAKNEILGAPEPPPHTFFQNSEDTFIRQTLWVRLGPILISPLNIDFST